MTFLRRSLVSLLGLALLVTPSLLRVYDLRYNDRAYAPGDDTRTDFAATPAPTTTARVENPQQSPNSAQQTSLLRAGPVIVDLAHSNSVNPTALEPLADALAERGRGLRLWLSTIDPLTVTNYLDYPDQSAALSAQLADASALIVISPFFLWSKAEIALVEHFVADGGRLLLISDPDIFGDFAAVTNFVAEPFGIVFNNDYLYDTIDNDENFTYFFQGDFRDQAAALDGARIAFYGGRSIAGAVASQAVSAPTTLSSLRTGASGFTTVAIGGIAANGTAGQVLALSDFDVLSEPYMRRHDNRLMVEFVAGFLAAEERQNTVADFPNYLAKSVAIAFGSQRALSAELLLQGAQLQKRLEASTRTVTLTSEQVLTGTTGLLAEDVLSATTDVIYLAEYESAIQATTLLTTAGIHLVEEELPATPTPVRPLASATPFPPTTPTAVQASATPTNTTQSSATPVATTTVTATVAISASVIVTLSTAITPTPATRLVVETNDGVRFVADETVLILQEKGPGDSRQVLAVLGADAKGISAGVTRLLANDFAECITGVRFTFCPIAPQTNATPAGKAAPAATASANQPALTPTPSRSPAAKDGKILLVDDNQEAAADENNEADRFLQALLAAGLAPDLITTRGGAPSADDLDAYTWVIWSNAGYKKSEISIAELEVLTTYLSNGGRLTVSSRNPLLGAKEAPASQVRDLDVVRDDPALVQGLSADTIPLAADLPPAVPLGADLEQIPAQIVLRRGATSDDASAPILFVVKEPESGARLQVSGFSLLWLTADDARQLTQNLAQWMMNENAD